jgi:hypothetical protein
MPNINYKNLIQLPSSAIPISRFLESANLPELFIDYEIMYAYIFLSSLHNKFRNDHFNLKYKPIK